MRSSSPERSAALEGALGSLRTRLIWLTAFRTVAVSLSLAAVAGRLFSQPAAEPSHADIWSFAIIGLSYVFTLVYSFMLRRGVVRRGTAAVQVLGDLVIASALVFLTGGVESPFTFTYLLTVVGASLVLERRGALLAAAASALAFAGVVMAIQLGWVEPPLGSAPLSTARTAFILASNLLAFFLIAILAGYLTRQLSTTGGQLSAREADLRKLGRLQQQILENIPSGLVTCDAAGHVTFVNPAAAAILGLEPGNYAGIHVSRLLPGALDGASHGRRRELSVETPVGSRTLGLSVALLGAAEEGALVIFQDLTELRRIEDDLRRADRLAALGTLSAQLAHEIRNPLAAMRGSAQLLVRDPSEDPSNARLIDILLREADRLSTLVNEFLAFAKPPPPTKRLLDLEVVVRETLEIMRLDPIANGIRLEVTLQPLQLAVDPDQLRQVLLNLLRNAFQAAGRGGSVRVSLDATKDEARLHIWDSGGSIAAANLSRIFEPFFSTKQGGTGLGLSTAHSIVRAHGGSMQVRSTPERGTEFVVGLPLESRGG